MAGGYMLADIEPYTPMPTPLPEPRGNPYAPRGIDIGGPNTGSLNPGGPPTGVGGPAPFDWQGLYNWDQRTSGYHDDAMRTLGGFSPVGSDFGRMLMQLFAEGSGFGPELLQRLKTQAAETNAGATQNALMRGDARSNATGFGKSAAANYAQDWTRQLGASNLQRALTDLDVQDRTLGLQSRQGMGGLLANLYGQQAGLTGQQAQLQANRTAPVYPGDFDPNAQTADNPTGRTDLFNPGGANNSWFS